MMTTDTFKKVKQVLWAILFLNFGVAFLKIFVGSFIHSSSMTADGFHSLTDGASNIVGLIGIRFASRPKDEDHPYGHGKFETLTGLFIGGMLFFISGKILLDATSRFMNPVIPQINAQSIITLVATLIINIFISFFEYRIGKRLNSQILISDSMHTKSDIYVSIGVLLTLAGIRLGAPAVIDPIASIIVSGFIIHAGYEIFKSTCDVLVDKAAIDQERIRRIVLDFDEVRDAHHIRSRGSESNLHIDMHIMTSPEMSVKECHDLIHVIENKIKDETHQNTEVIVHIEPFQEVIKP